MIIIPQFPNGSTKNLFYSNSDKAPKIGDTLRIEGHPSYVIDEVTNITSKTLNLFIITLKFKEDSENGKHYNCS